MTDRLPLDCGLSIQWVGWDRTDAIFAVDPGTRATRRTSALDAKKRRSCHHGLLDASRPPGRRVS
jgi:hypothetical protein